MVLSALFLIVNIAIVLLPVQKASATSASNVLGWAWSSTGGWLSANDLNSGSGGGSYGINFDGATRKLTGFAWSPNAGWMCVGETCTTACNGTTPSGGAPFANVDGSGNVTGWGKFCNLGTGGWVSFNCSNMAGECAAAGNYKVTINFTSGAFGGWAWHGLSGANGWGWIDFSRVYIGGVEDFNINSALCQDGNENDIPTNNLIDCADPKCKYHEPSCPASEDRCWINGGSNCCSNGLDDDVNGQIDCADAACASAVNCQTEICTNGIDDNGINGIDCADPQCSTDPSCTAAWLQSKFGNILASNGVGGNGAPSLQSNSTYCITSGGVIQNFKSAIGCTEQGIATSTLPIATGGYVSTLGHIDITGVLAGRYGQVVNITSAAQIPTNLAGKVYVYTETGSCSSPFTLGAMTFQNAAGTNKGSGTIVIKGCDLKITGDMSYQGSGASSYLRNLASVGILVLAKYNGTTYQQGGNLYVDPTVAQAVGTIYAEKAIWTGTNVLPNPDIQLQVYGALVSKQIHLQRRFVAPNQPAENVEFDGRAVVNPPPGFQDVAKSLPRLTDKY
ncbi:MAG: hypothetical protein WC477_00575 [Patescibacteria group bacterium]